MAAITQYGPHGLPMRRYGSFAGKEASAAGPHPVAKITQYGPHGLPMRRYGSFSGKAGTGVIAEEDIRLLMLLGVGF